VNPRGDHSHGLDQHPARSQSAALFERARVFVTGGELMALLERLKASTPARFWSV